MKLNDGRIAIPLLQDAAGQRVMEKKSRSLVTCYFTHTTTKIINTFMLSMVIVVCNL